MSFSYAQNQYKIVFSYDSAGNQTLRNKVCVNCSKIAAKVIDSTLVENLETVSELLKDPIKEDEVFKDKIEESGTSKISAYPNPVTNLLRVEWIESDNSVQRVALFSNSGKQLLDTQINSTQSGVDLSFSKYTPGNYIVIVFYADKTRQSFQVIKK